VLLAGGGGSQSEGDSIAELFEKEDCNHDENVGELKNQVIISYRDCLTGCRSRDVASRRICDGD
jgi:hypothetical protein